MPHEVIMPALGMAQDTGLIVSWGKAPGEQVTADDVLLEVETDKSTMEVPAGHDGFLAEVRAEAGQDVPVGHVIAVITESEPAETIVSRWDAGNGELAVEQAPPVDVPAPAADKQASQQAAPRSETAPLPDGPVLASPKARRLAKDESLDLDQLARAGYPQPFHVKDLDVLRTLSDAPASAGTSTNSVAVPPPGEITAWIDANAFADFALKLAEGGTPEPVRPRILAAFAAASLAATGQVPESLVVRIEDGSDLGVHPFANPHRGRISTLDEMADSTQSAPTLIVRDLTATGITQARIAGDNVPAINILQSGGGLDIQLVYPPATLEARRALRLVTELTARLTQPLNHIL